MMGLYAVKPRFQRRLHGLTIILVRRQVHPDHLTLAAVVLSALGGAALSAARWLPWLLVLVLPLVLGRTTLNALDGLVARTADLARPWGTVLNEVCDRLSDMALFSGAALAPGSDVRLGLATLVLMLLSSYVGTAAQAAGGRRQYGGIMGKADRMIALGGASVAALLLPSVPVFTYLLLAIAVGVSVTLAQRLRAAHADLQSVH